MLPLGSTTLLGLHTRQAYTSFLNHAAQGWLTRWWRTVVQAQVWLPASSSNGARSSSPSTPALGCSAAPVTRSPGLRAVIADAAAVPLASRHLDVICFGQSWHWVDQDLGAREAARVLKPGGWWAAWWNHPWADSEPWFDRYCSLLEARCDGFSRHQRNVDWCAEAVAAVEPFRRPERHIVHWERRVTVEDWLTDLVSHSYVIDMAEWDRSRLLLDATSILRARFPHGTMAVPYQTRLWMAQLA